MPGQAVKKIPHFIISMFPKQHLALFMTVSSCSKKKELVLNC